MNTTTSLLTADEFFAMPDDGFRYDLVKGELRKMSPAGEITEKFCPVRLTSCLFATKRV
jgi:Uma2 family endonuclease